MDNSCLNCSLAEWALTSNGRLHPSGEGRCKYFFQIPALPKSMYIVGGPPSIGGGFIDRKEPETECPQFVEDIFRSGK